MSGGTFRGGTWDWPRRELEREATELAMAMHPAIKITLDPELGIEMDPDPEPAERPFAQSELLVMLELVRAELVKLRLVMEGVQHRGTVTRDDALEDIQRHWNVAAK